MDRGIEEEGSNLSGVTSRCAWEPVITADSNQSDADHEEDKENRLLEREGSRNELDRRQLSLFGEYIIIIP